MVMIGVLKMIYLLVNHRVHGAILLIQKERFLKQTLIFTLFLKKKVGDGHSTRFWHDVWVGNTPLKYVYQRLFTLETHCQCFVNERGEI